MKDTHSADVHVAKEGDDNRGSKDIRKKEGVTPDVNVNSLQSNFYIFIY